MKKKHNLDSFEERVQFYMKNYPKEAIARMLVSMQDQNYEITKLAVKMSKEIKNEKI